MSELESENDDLREKVKNLEEREDRWKKVLLRIWWSLFPFRDEEYDAYKARDAINDGDLSCLEKTIKQGDDRLMYKSPCCGAWGFLNKNNGLVFCYKCRALWNPVILERMKP